MVGLVVITTGGRLCVVWAEHLITCMVGADDMGIAGWVVWLAIILCYLWAVLLVWVAIIMVVALVIFRVWRSWVVRC